MRALAFVTAVVVAACDDTAAAPVEAAPAPIAAAAPTIEPTPVPAPVPADPPATALPLVLLATLVADDPTASKATIRDETAKTVISYRPGDPIRDDAIVVRVLPGKVVIVHDEREELLAVGVAPAELAPDDVFYPDLVDDDLSDTMADGVQLQSGQGWEVKKSVFAWGTPRTVHRLREALRTYARRDPQSPDVHVGDISKAGGGPFPPHLSHRIGRDVDIGYVLQGRSAHESRFVHTDASNLDRARTWALVQTLLETRAVAWIFMDYEIQRLLFEHARAQGVAADRLDAWFQYPAGNRATRGIIRDWRGHDDHFHVRFTE